MNAADRFQRTQREVLSFINNQHAPGVAQLVDAGFAKFMHIAAGTEPQQVAEFFQDYACGVARVGLNQQRIPVFRDVGFANHRLAQTGFAVKHVDITFDVRHAYNINGFARCWGINKFDADTCRALFFMLTIDKATNIVFQRCNIAVVFIIQVLADYGRALTNSAGDLRLVKTFCFHQFDKFIFS